MNEYLLKLEVPFVNDTQPVGGLREKKGWEERPNDGGVKLMEKGLH